MWYLGSDQPAGHQHHRGAGVAAAVVAAVLFRAFWPNSCGSGIWWCPCLAATWRAVY